MQGQEPLYGEPEAERCGCRLDTLIRQARRLLSIIPPSATSRRRLCTYAVAILYHGRLMTPARPIPRLLFLLSSSPVRITTLFTRPDQAFHLSSVPTLPSLRGSRPTTLPASSGINHHPHHHCHHPQHRKYVPSPNRVP